MKSASNREKDKFNDNHKRLSAMTDSILRNYEHTLQTGLKLNEEAGRWWSSLLNQPLLTEEWQRRVAHMTELGNGLVPLAQRPMEDVIALMERNSRAGAEVMKQALDAAQTPTIAESQAKWLQVWSSSMGTVRTNTEAISQISSKAIDSWIDFVRKNTELAEVRVPKAA